jgi:hypothetical protein
MEHELKCWPEPFAAVEAGLKPYEVCRADRPYAVGDVLVLREWDIDRAVRYQEQHGEAGAASMEDWARVRAEATEIAYTGRACRRRITHILQGGQFGIEAGYVVLSLEEAPDA